MSLDTLIGSYGPLAVFIGAMVEGETVAILGGILAHRGASDALTAWAGMAAVAGGGAFLSDQLWFALARHAPDRGLVGRMRARAAHSPLRSRLEGGRHLMAFAFRFIPGARIIGPVALAQTAIRWPVFAGLNALAVAIWAGIFTAIGYHFGRAAEGVLGRLPLHHWLLMLVGVALAGLALHRFIRHRARQD